MSQFDKHIFLAHIPQLQYTSDEMTCWSQIELGVREFARQHANQETSESLPFQQWWKTAYDLLACRQVYISALNFAPSALGDEEFIEVNNAGPAIVDLSGWRINAGTDQNYIFPPGTLIMPGKPLRVYTQPGAALSFESHQQLWNNKGDTATIYDQRDNTVNSWCYRVHAHEHICITNINFDGEVRHTEADEFVELTNISSHWLDISGWHLDSQHQVEFVFPPSSLVAPHQRIRVYTNQVHPESGGFSFGSHKAIWNNQGGTATLSDDLRHQVSFLKY